MASQAYEHQYYRDSQKDAATQLWQFSSQSPPSNATSLHNPIVNDEPSSPDLTTSTPTCPSICSSSPTWKPDGEVSWREMRMSGQPRQHHLHHYHHHHHYYQCPAACSCPCYASAKPADPSQLSSHTYAHTHLLVPSHKTHPHCRFHAEEHIHCPLLSKEHSGCSLVCDEHTHCPLLAEVRTHIAPCPYHLTEHTHSTPSTDHSHITPSTERTSIPAISPLQKSTHHDIDSHATPQVHLNLQKPKRPKSHRKLCTPFPSPNAPPYILCQHCFQLLSPPLSPPLHVLTLAPILKLKCALCTRISFFSTLHRHHMPSSSDAIQLGHSHTLKASKGIADGDFQLQVKQSSIDVDATTFDASSKEECFLLRLEQKSMDAHVPTTDASVDGLQREKRSMDTHFSIIDTEAGASILPMKEQEIIDTSAVIDKISTEGLIQGNYVPQSPPKLNPEFAGFSSVQDWVNSIEQESFLHCPTPLIGTGFGSDLQLPEPIDWQINEEHAGDAFNLPVPGSPLHEHFGYKSPTELLNKTLSSDDDIKMPSDTNSSASTSATSANTFKPPGFENTDGLAYKNACKIAFVKQGSKNSIEISADTEQNDQGSLANFFRRSFKGLGERKSSSVSSSKSRVVVNGHTLSQLVIRRAEERAGKLRPGTYWYDSKAGFWGITGGPCLGVLPPFIEDLHYPMSKDCSNGDTQVFVNGRELHHKDLAVLTLRGLSRKPGMAYAIDFDGIVIEETSGRELKHLGKLAPTVERRGRGFGMYMAKQ